ncbi:hypothetical protein ACLOJK_041649 [Asimina triloba]
MQLRQIVAEYLGTERYGMVVNDVWRAEAREELNVAYPRNKHGSRIMLTTRQENVASLLGHASRTYPLDPLEEEALFSKNAFWKEPCPLPQRFGAISSKNLLSLREQTVAEWAKVHDDLNRQSSQNETIKHILLLSYYDLAYNLKHCFLSCRLVPEDHLIRRKLMIR